MKPPRTADDVQEDNPNQNVTQEVPSMRAMPLMTRLPKLASEGDSQLFGNEKQALSESHPPLKKSFRLPRPVAGRSNQFTEDKFGLKHEWDGVSTQSLWDVKGEDLEVVPWEFPLERTHREIEEEACFVASRISEILRRMSVEAEYCSKQAKAKCRTSDFVSFRIRLFAGSETGQPVVVELQRRSGSASSFMRTCRAVLDAAEGKDTKDVPAIVTRGLPPAHKLPVSSMSCLSQVASTSSELESDANEALQSALGLFRSDNRDTSLLGLENLGCITDPLKTSAAVALSVSKSLLAAEDVREEFRILVERDVFSGEENDQEGALNIRDHQRFLCLYGSLVNVASDSWFAGCLVPLLVNELDRVETGLHNAFKATVCLHGLVSCSPIIRHNMRMDNGARKAMEKSYRMGQSRHELLACESRRCLDVLNSARDRLE